jgi:hypothetical protein
MRIVARLSPGPAWKSQEEPLLLEMHGGADRELN